MTLLLPVCLFFILGPAGAVIGVLVGLLIDEVLYAVLVVNASLALVVGRPWRVFPGLPELALSELGLILVADRNHDQTIFQRYQIAREWLESGTYRLRNRRFTSQLARVWTALHQRAGDIDVGFLTGKIAQQAGPERRHELFGVLTTCCALDVDGTDLDDLAFLYALALGLDLPVLAFHQSLTSNYCLRREACAILGIGLHDGRDALMRVAASLPPPDTQSADAMIRRQAFALVEDQLDALERTAERYRLATLREQR